MTKLLLYGVTALVVVFGVMQLVPVDRRNPPVESDIPTSPEVKTVLRRACYDCHSNETVWPWYSRIAPVSWLIVHDVHEGREELNFSTWNRYSTKHQVKKLQESWEEVEEGEMPPWFYTTSHREAQLSAQDQALLWKWAVTAHEKPGADATPRRQSRH